MILMPVGLVSPQGCIIPHNAARLYFSNGSYMILRYHCSKSLTRSLSRLVFPSFYRTPIGIHPSLATMISCKSNIRFLQCSIWWLPSLEEDKAV